MTEPIRKSLLPTTPPSEWEFASVLGAPHGCVLLPTDTGDVVVRRRVTYGDWEPVRPDRWADEPNAGIRDAARQAAGQPTADEAPQYGVDGCTCRPWTNRGDGARWCTPDDTIDMVAGWDPGPGCPRHPAAGLAAPTNRNTETARARLAALIGYEPGEHDAKFEQLLDAYRAAILNRAADEADRLSTETEQRLKTREVGPLTALQDLADTLRRLAAGAES